MFFGKRKHTTLPDLGWIGVDMHSHLIPAIDDGVQDLTSSIELIQGLMNLGYSKIITTPHVLWEVYPNTNEIIIQGKTEVQKVIEEKKLEVDFHAAAEYFIDDHFEEDLRNKKPLLTLKDNLVLVEFSMVTAPMDLQDAIFQMELQNYQPVIAHPERYSYLQTKKSFYDDLRNSGCLFQLNLLSLTGAYGNTVQELAEYLIRKEYYDFAGTDVHGIRHIQGMQKLSGSTSLQRLKDSGMIRNREMLK